MPGRARSIATAACASVTALMVSAAPALGAGPDYYVTPTAGLNFECTQAVPCSVETAASMAGSGDRILMAPGNYNMGFSMSLNAALMPQTPGTRPLLESPGGQTISVGGSAVIRDIRLVVSNMPTATYALNFSGGGRAERVEVFASNSGPSSTPAAAAMNSGTVITDSVMVADGDSAVAVFGGNEGGTIRNSTLIATGANSVGFSASPSYMGPGVTTMTTTVQNSIVRGAAFGFSVFGDPTRTVIVNTDHSNYPAANNVGMTNAALNGTPQTEDPLFSAAGSGDFHQLASSPTRNAGAAVPALSATDLDGQPRNQEGAPDIGADEFNVPATPSTPGPPAKAKKCKKRKGKGRASPAKKKCKKPKKRR